MPATTKLYPPVIAGTLPSMIYSKGPLLRVPFSMNRAVAASQVTGLRMRLRTTNTDTILCEVDLNVNTEAPNIYPITSTSTAEDSLVAVFSLLPWRQRLSIGQSYKIQIAFIDKDNACGYYSTVAIVKCTNDITVNIVGLDSFGNNYDFQEFTGEYLNSDTTEVVYQYKFDLYSSSYELIESSGWQPHAEYGDTEAGRSEDHWSLGKILIVDEYYLLRYVVQTNSFQEISSPWYTIIAGTGLPSDTRAPLKAVLDYDNGLIKIKYNAIFDTNAGRYEFSRSSSKDNFGSWTKLFNFSLTEDMVTGQYFYTDFMVEHGVTYRYSVRQYNSRGLYSRRTISNDVTAYFEDLFLWDGERQLDIRFNPKVTAFKRTLNESKKNTIGSKYPKYFRNGVVDYKEFQLSGLLSYLMDRDGYFYSREELGYGNHEDETDITDENLTLERRFNMTALQWLSNGKPKLLKSPGEGNYIVYLMNSSLTPNDSVSRMLHTFQSQASECGNADDLNDLIKFGLYKAPYDGTSTSAAVHQTFTYYTISLTDVFKNQNVETPSLNVYEGVGSLKIENCVPGTMFNLRIVGVDGITTDYRHITIGATGYYALTLPTGSLIKEITIGRVQEPASIYDTLYNGVVTVGAITKSDFNTVNYCNPVEELCIQRWGLGPQVNLLDCMLPISRLYKLKFSRFTGQSVQATEYIKDNTTLQYHDGVYYRGDILIPYFVLDSVGTTMDPHIFVTKGPDKENENTYYYYGYGAGSHIDYTAQLQFEDGSVINLNLDSLRGTQLFTQFKSIPTKITAGNGVLVEISCQTQEAIYQTHRDDTQHYYDNYIRAKRELQTFIHSPQSWENTDESLHALQYQWVTHYNELIITYNRALYDYSKALKAIWGNITSALSDIDIYNIDAYKDNSLADETLILNNHAYTTGVTYADSGKKPTRKNIGGTSL